MLEFKFKTISSKERFIVSQLTILSRAEIRSLKLKCLWGTDKVYRERRPLGASVLHLKAATQLTLGGCLDNIKASVARASDFAGDVGIPKLCVTSPPKIKTLCESSYIHLWPHAATL